LCGCSGSSHASIPRRPTVRTYRLTGRGAVPAFSIEPSQVKDKELAQTLRQLGIKDALDFDKQLNQRERRIVQRKGLNNSSVADLLKHRIALGIVPYPNTARYLVEHYERLEGRVFEKKRFTDMGKRWYKYHRPRDPAIMLGENRILSPTLVQQVRFAPDTVGYLSDHACLFLQPTVKTVAEWSKLHEQIAETFGHRISDEDALKYCLAFLNSDYAQKRLVTGHRPRPGEVYAVSESFLNEIPVPPPPDRKTLITINSLVDKLTTETDQDKVSRLEAELSKLVHEFTG
jgi:hypothetical protein